MADKLTCECGDGPFASPAGLRGHKQLSKKHQPETTATADPPATSEWDQLVWPGDFPLPGLWDAIDWNKPIERDGSWPLRGVPSYEGVSAPPVAPAATSEWDQLVWPADLPFPAPRPGMPGYYPSKAPDSDGQTAELHHLCDEQECLKCQTRLAERDEEVASLTTTEMPKLFYHELPNFPQDFQRWIDKNNAANRPRLSLIEGRPKLHYDADMTKRTREALSKLPMMLAIGELRAMMNAKQKREGG